jgi:hypothetical protein
MTLLRETRLASERARPGFSQKIPAWVFRPKKKKPTEAVKL